MRRILGGLLFLLAALGLPGATVADEPSQAGLIVEFGDGRVETRCITFEEEEITGADLLLTHSGLEAIIDASSGMGITVCQLEGEGCAYPSEPCFCQCMGGGGCAYWNYFYREPGNSEWTYSALGAVLRKVRHGSVEAWVWGDGSTLPTFDGTFASICAAPTVVEPTATVEATSSPEPPTATPTAAPAEPAPTQPPDPTETPRATSTAAQPAPTQMPEPGATSALASYWPFGLMVLGLVAIGLFVRRRGA
jgi:cell division septation protein DedD